MKKDTIFYITLFGLMGLAIGSIPNVAYTTSSYNIWTVAAFRELFKNFSITDAIVKTCILYAFMLMFYFKIHRKLDKGKLSEEELKDRHYELKGAFSILFGLYLVDHLNTILLSCSRTLNCILITSGITLFFVYAAYCFLVYCMVVGNASLPQKDYK